MTFGFFLFICLYGIAEAYYTHTIIKDINEALVEIRRDQDKLSIKMEELENEMFKFKTSVFKLINDKSQYDEKTK